MLDVIPQEVLERFLGMSDGFSLWRVRQCVAALILFAAIWLAAFALARFQAFWGGDPILRTYFGWLLPIGAVAVILAVESVVASFHFRSAGLGVLTIIPLSLGALAASSLGVVLSRKVSRRVDARREIDQLRA